MATLDLTNLAQLASVDFQTFKDFYAVPGQSIADDYYRELGIQGSAAGLTNVVAYANLAQDVANNSGINGVFANNYSFNVAADNGVNFAVGSDNWLSVQYALMQADFQLRQQKITDGDTGELDYNDTIIVHTQAFGTIGLPPETFSLFTPLSQIAESNPDRAQELFERVMPDQGVLDLTTDALTLGFGVTVSTNQPLSEIFQDYADQAAWISNSAAALQAIIDTVPGIDPDTQTAIQQRIDAFQVIADLVDGTFEGMAAAVEAMAEFYHNATDVLQGVDDGLISEFARQFVRENQLWDPLIVDLDGNGFANTVNTQVYFDMDSDGLFAELTNAWITPDDGFIVWDKNGNDKADNGTELFGAGVSENSWDNLAVHDLNVDGVIDADDAIWTQLHIWQDANGDGITQGDEWFGLADFGITAINFPSGTNPFLGSVSTDSGTLRTRGVQFNPDESNTRFTGEVEIDFTTLFLPELRGFNHLNDLRIAMSLDSEGAGSLLEQAMTLATRPLADTFADMLQFRGDFTQMMYQWAGVADINPASRGAFLSDARQRVRHFYRAANDNCRERSQHHRLAA